MVCSSDRAGRPFRSNAAARTFTGPFEPAAFAGVCGSTPRTIATALSALPGIANGATVTLSGTSVRGNTPSITAAVAGDMRLGAVPFACVSPV